MCCATLFFPPTNSESRFDAPLGHSDPGGTRNTNTVVCISLYLSWKAKFWLRLYKRTTTCEYSNYPIDLGHTAHVLSQVFNLQNISYTDGPTIPQAKTITLSEWHPAGLFRNNSINTMNKWQTINYAQITLYLYLFHRLFLERTH